MSSQLVLGKTYESIFCPNCGVFIVLPEGEYPNEVYCPSENNIVALTPKSKKGGTFYVTEISETSVTIDLC